MTAPDIVTFARDELGVPLHPGQAAALAGYYTSGRPNWLLLAGRRGGKSLLSDCIVAYESVVPSFAGYLRPGEDRYVIVTSVRQDAANQHIRQIARLLRHTRALARLVLEESKDRLRLSNGVVILSLPASARAGRGWTASTVIFDELAHFVDSQGNPGADAVFDAFAPTVATFGDLARLIITTTPATRAGIVYDLFERSQAGELDDFYVTRAPTRQLNPKVSEKTIARAAARDAESAAVEYDAEFREPIEAFLSGEAIDRAIDRGFGGLLARASSDRPDPGRTYSMAVDPAVMQDRYGFLVGHREGERVIVDYAHLLHPPIDPAAAEVLLADLARRFRPVAIRTDSAALVQRLGRELPALVYEPFTRPRKLQWYGAVKEALNLGRLSLPKQDDLIAELRALQIRNGVDIGHPKSGAVRHDDLADCLALVVDSLVGTQGESARVSPNLFYGPAADRIEAGQRYVRAGDGWAWIAAENVGHTHELTAEAVSRCRKRATGCPACIAYYEASGEFSRQALELEASLGRHAGQPATAEEARAEFEAQQGHGPAGQEGGESLAYQRLMRRVINLGGMRRDH